MITVAQVTQASDIELLCITYELFLEQIQLAIDNLEHSKMHIQKARDILKILVANLDLTIPVAQDIYDIYIYVQKLLVNNEDLEAVYRIITNLKSGYEDLKKSELVNSHKVMENTQNIYAGMTYHGNHLNEMVVENSNRGFMA